MFKHTEQFAHLPNMKIWVSNFLGYFLSISKLSPYRHTKGKLPHKQSVPKVREAFKKIIKIEEDVNGVKF